MMKTLDCVDIAVYFDNRQTVVGS